MSALASILLGAAGDLAVPIIKKILGDKLGGASGEIAGKVIDIIADKAGVTPDKLPGVPDDDLRDAIIAAEPAAADILVQHVESQRLMNETLQAELDKGGPIWTWAWRPGWMWLLGFIWLYTIVLRPLVNAAFGASIEAIDLGTLMVLTGTFTTFYMGGHTALRGIKEWRAGK
ncbi:MAG: hypothetical protein KJZ83_06920 [Burkholderiaceae bacterium]|nr:hypothetical protein [Burkholderiaceae bacterium]